MNIFSRLGHALGSSRRIQFVVVRRIVLLCDLQEESVLNRKTAFFQEWRPFQLWPFRYIGRWCTVKSEDFSEQVTLSYVREYLPQCQGWEKVEIVEEYSAFPCFVRFFY